MRFMGKRLEKTRSRIISYIFDYTDIKGGKSLVEKDGLTKGLSWQKAG